MKIVTRNGESGKKRMKPGERKKEEKRTRRKEGRKRAGR